MIGKSSPGYLRQAVLQIDHASSLQSQPSGSGSASGIGSAWSYQVDIVNQYIVIKRQSHQHRHDDTNLVNLLWKIEKQTAFHVF